MALIVARQGFFNRFSKMMIRLTGHHNSFLLSLLIVIIWALTGPLFHFSDTWQLVINTGTTIVTFLMVFLIQNSQNRDTYALQLKLDELIRSTQDAHNSLLDIEELTEEELLQLKKFYAKLANKALKDLRAGRKDTGKAEIELSLARNPKAGVKTNGPRFERAGAHGASK